MCCAGMSGISNIMRQTTDLATKTPVSCTTINKIYNNDSGMSGIDKMGKKQLLTDSIVKGSITFI